MSPSAWSVKFPVYQIDFSCVAAGKNIAATKRKIRWRFGFPNKKALDDGLHGTDCRGEEHEINVVWSLTSGKRQVTMDSKEVHYSTSRQGILDFSFTTRGNHVIKLVCHAAPPLSATPGFRQYDLFVDGQSFFTMPKMYELGVRGDAKYNRVPGYTGTNNYSNPTSPITLGSGSQQSRSFASNDYHQPASRQQEEEDLRRAIQASIEESRAHLQSKGGGGGDDNRSSYTAPLGGGNNNSDLLDLAGGGGGAITNPTPSPHDARSVGSYYSAPTTYHQHPPSGGFTPSSAATYQSPPPQQAGALVPAHGPAGGYYNAPPPQVGNSFATPPPVPPAPAPTPSFATPPPAEPMYSPAVIPPAPIAPSASAPAAPLYIQPPAPGGGYQGQNYMNTPTPQSSDVFGLNSPPGVDPFAPKAPPPPSYQDLTTSIMGAYTSPSTTGSAPPVTPGSAASGGPPMANGFASPQATGGNPPVANGGGLSMNALTITEEEKPKDSFDSVLKKLVNVDHIDEPAEGEFKLTMMKQEEEKKKLKKGHSVPLPPVTTGRVGTGATLSEIKSVRPGGSGTLKHDTEGKIMRPPPLNAFQPGAVHAGALVVHGQGPPALQQPMGFGVGAHLPNGGLQNQQQPTYYMPQQQQAQYR